MNVQVQRYRDRVYVSCLSSEVFIRTTQDILELLAFGMDHKTNLFILEETNFDPSFYDLSTGLAGDILQKFSNYSSRIVIVGTFDKVKSMKFQEFMFESNKGSQVRFTDTSNKALAWLIQEPHNDSLGFCAT